MTWVLQINGRDQRGTLSATSDWVRMGARGSGGGASALGSPVPLRRFIEDAAKGTNKTKLLFGVIMHS